MASYNIITTPYDAGRYHVNVAYEGTLNGRPVTPLERIEHLVYGIICLIPLINIIAERILFAMGKHTLEALSAREVETRPPAPLQPTDVGAMNQQTPEDVTAREVETRPPAPLQLTDVKDETLIPFAIEVSSCLDPEDEKIRYMLLKLVAKKREQKATTMNFTFCIDRSWVTPGNTSGWSSRSNIGIQRGLAEKRLVRVKTLMGRFLDRAMSWVEYNPSNKMNISVMTYTSEFNFDIPWMKLTKETIDKVRQKITEIKIGEKTSSLRKIFSGVEAASEKMVAMAKADRAAINSLVFMYTNNKNLLPKEYHKNSGAFNTLEQKIKEHDAKLYVLGFRKHSDHELMRTTHRDKKKRLMEQLPSAQYEWIDEVEVEPYEFFPDQTTITRALTMMFNLADPHCGSNIQCKLTAASGTVELALKTPDENGVFSLGELFHERESSFLFTVGDNRELKLELTYDVNGQKYRVQRTLTLRDSGNRQEMLDRVLKRELANYYKDIDTIEDLDQKLAMTKAIIERIKNLDSCTRGDEWSEGLLHIITGDLMNRESGFELKLEEAASGIKEANPLVSNAHNKRE